MVNWQVLVQPEHHHHHQRKRIQIRDALFLIYWINVLCNWQFRRYVLTITAPHVLPREEQKHYRFSSSHPVPYTHPYTIHSWTSPSDSDCSGQMVRDAPYSRFYHVHILQSPLPYIALLTNAVQVCRNSCFPVVRQVL